ncbi:hypothetical protein NU09_1080 [Flavobacterium beibuense]|uniref:Uncharacterized protein n=1 Tax=Flavobacterium beibuense TaxID=657326 RepID=A0A444WF44_9FLAO|nr:hypothetical protein NU09_1080 [Flavobacterium beibuense]
MLWAVFNLESILFYSISLFLSKTLRARCEAGSLLFVLFVGKAVNKKPAIGRFS